MTDRAMLWVVLYGIIPFWFLNGDPTYSLAQSLFQETFLDSFQECRLPG